MLHFSCPVESSEEAMEAGETIPSTEAGTALFALLATVATADLGDVRGVGRVPLHVVDEVEPPAADRAGKRLGRGAVHQHVLVQVTLVRECLGTFGAGQCLCVCLRNDFRNVQRGLGSD